MTIKSVLIAISIIHCFMIIGIFFTIYDHEELNTATKIKLFTLALLLPILGPIYVNYLLKTRVFMNGKFIDTTDYSGSFESGSVQSTDSGSSSDGGGGSD